jgi:hypothetical protein
MESLPEPIARLQSVAASADPRDIGKYKPNSADYALTGALLSTTAPTFKALSEAAGISTDTLDRILNDPARSAWIVSRMAEGAKLARGAVYARLVDMALTSRSAAWARLFLEKFDDLKTKEGAIATQNNQFNIYAEMSESELKAFVTQKARQVMGNE